MASSLTGEVIVHDLGERGSPRWLNRPPTHGLRVRDLLQGIALPYNRKALNTARVDWREIIGFIEGSTLNELWRLGTPPVEAVEPSPASAGEHPLD